MGVPFRSFTHHCSRKLKYQQKEAELREQYDEEMKSYKEGETWKAGIVNLIELACGVRMCEMDRALFEITPVPQEKHRKTFRPGSSIAALASKATDTKWLLFELFKEMTSIPSTLWQEFTKTSGKIKREMLTEAMKVQASSDSNFIFLVGQILSDPLSLSLSLSLFLCVVII